MKKIDPTFTTVKKTVCPFCSFGCELGVVFDEFGVKGVEYIKEGSSEGRLCPRGSAAALYLNHPKRLSMPMKNGKVLEWSKLIKDLKKIIGAPKNVAVTFDRNITIEEYESIISFCNKTGIENIASTYFEPEIFLKKFLNKPFSLDEIDNAQMIIVLGDPFSQAPMISKALINWKLRDRKNRLVVIDTINSHTAGFANDFLKGTVGTEPILLFSLAQENIGNIDIPAITNIAESKITEISKSFKQAENGLIIVSLPFAHTYDPLLLTQGLVKLSTFSNKKVVPLVEFAGFEGNQYFGSIMSLVKKKKIKHLINFGELFPFYYAQVAKNLKALNIYSTSTIKYNGYTTIPAALNLEKEGTILTNFGKKKLDGNIKPPSGAKTISEILALFQEMSGKGKRLDMPELKINIKERAKKLVEKCTTPKTKKKKIFKLIGEKIAYNFLGFFEKEILKLNLHDAKELGIKQNDIISIKSKHGSIELAAKLTKDVEKGIVSIPAETPEVKSLFDFDIDNNIINFIPTEVEIWRRG
ncbi:hypothetical protein KAX97_10280 [candidate division WOR-3 bacterium]|nr:hypothetical protein [candidate division WOR-3 bacterium]